jgi:hypothetical protein
VTNNLIRISKKKKRKKEKKLSGEEITWRVVIITEFMVHGKQLFMENFCILTYCTHICNRMTRKFNE